MEKMAVKRLKHDRRMINEYTAHAIEWEKILSKMLPPPSGWYDGYVEGELCSVQYANGQVIDVFIKEDK